MSTVTHRRVKSKPFDFLMPNYAFKTAPVLLHYCKMIQKHNTEDTDMQTHSAYIYHPLLIARWLMLSTIEGAARKPHALMRIAPRNDGQSSTVGIIKLLAPALPGLCACFLTVPVFSLCKWDGSHCYLTGLLGSKKKREKRWNYS